MIIDLKGKTALVCGSTQGIGFETVKLMAKRGARLTLLSRNEDKLKKVVKELEVIDGVEHDYLVADFSYPEKLKTVIFEYVNLGNKPNILVNNTGGPKGGPIIEANISEFINTFNQHLILSLIHILTLPTILLV